MENIGIIFEEKMKKIKNSVEDKTAQSLVAVNTHTHRYLYRQQNLVI